MMPNGNNAWINPQYTANNNANVAGGVMSINKNEFDNIDGAIFSNANPAHSGPGRYASNNYMRKYDFDDDNSTVLSNTSSLAPSRSGPPPSRGRNGNNSLTRKRNEYGYEDGDNSTILSNAGSVVSSRSGPPPARGRNGNNNSMRTPN
eukprot:9950696-Ditylum_brightwellii.AAC.1